MTRAALADPVLARIKREVEALYGPKLKRVLLYGSRARGDARADSDYDVLVVLEEPFRWWDETMRLADLSETILVESLDTPTPVVVSFKTMTESETQQRTGFMHNVRAEAIAL